MLKTLTVAEYMEMVQGEGLLVKSMAGNTMTTDSVGSEEEEPELKEEEEEGEEEDEEDDEEEDEENDGPTSFVLTISTDDEDRIRDVLDPMGCVTDNFANNPLFLYEHGATEKGPMSNPDSILGQIKSLTLNPEEKSITALARYVPREGNLLVKKVLDMERKGLIPGNSMGWLPISGIQYNEATGQRFIAKWEILEVSKVIVPVNGRAITKQFPNNRSPTAKLSD